MKTVTIFLVALLIACAVQAERFIVYWQPEDVARYIVYRSTDPNTGFVPLDSTVVDTFYVDTTVPIGPRVYYRLRSVAADGQRSVLSSPLSGQCLAPGSSAVQVLSLTKLSANTYRVRWASALPTVGFVLARPAGGSWTFYDWDRTLATEHTATLTGLVEPQSYEFQVAAYPDQQPLALTLSAPYAAATLAPAPDPATWVRILPF